MDTPPQPADDPSPPDPPRLAPGRPARRGSRRPHRRRRGGRPRPLHGQLPHRRAGRVLPLLAAVSEAPGRSRPRPRHPHRGQPARLRPPHSTGTSTNAATSATLDVCQEDLCFSAGRLPAVAEMRRLVEVLDRSERPLLFHCQRGTDRTGLASAVALLLLTDRPYDEARRQLGLRYGHVALRRHGQPRPVLRPLRGVARPQRTDPFARRLPPLGRARILPRRLPRRDRAARPPAHGSGRRAVRRPRPLPQHLGTALAIFALGQRRRPRHVRCHRRAAGPSWPTAGRVCSTPRSRPARAST